MTSILPNPKTFSNTLKLYCVIFDSYKPNLMDFKIAWDRHASMTKCSGIGTERWRRISLHQSRIISRAVSSMEASLGMSLSRMRNPSHT